MSEKIIIKKIAEAIQRAISKSTYMVEETAKALCPTSPSGGQLKGSIKADYKNGIVYTNMEYAQYIEYGLPQPIKPKTAKVLAWTKPGVSRPDSNDKEGWKRLSKQGKVIYAKEAWPNKRIGSGQDGMGISKRSFMRPALWNNKQKILKIFKQEIQNIK